MRIVNRQEFLTLPENTVYAASSPSGSFGEPLVKLETSGNDWYYDNLFDFDDYNDSSEFNEKVDQMIHEGKQFPLKLDTMGRDGCFDDDQLYVIYDNDDVKKIIERLEKCLMNAVDFVNLEAIAKKHGVTPRQAWDIAMDVKIISIPTVIEQEEGYKGDPHSQTE